MALALLLVASHRMEDLPLYGVGISAGSAFLLKMPRYMRVGVGGGASLRGWCLLCRPLDCALLNMPHYMRVGGCRWVDGWLPPCRHLLSLLLCPPSSSAPQPTGLPTIAVWRRHL